MLKNFLMLIIIAISLGTSPSMLNASQPPRRVTPEIICALASIDSFVAKFVNAYTEVYPDTSLLDVPGLPEWFAVQRLNGRTEVDSLLPKRARPADAVPVKQLAASSSTTYTGATPIHLGALPTQQALIPMQQRSTVQQVQKPASTQEPYPVGWVFPTDMAAMTPEEEGLLRVTHPLMPHIGVREVLALLGVSKRVRSRMQSIIRGNPIIKNTLVQYHKTYGHPIVIRPKFVDASKFDVFAQQFYTQLRAELSGKAGCHVGIDLSDIEDLRFVAPDIFANFMHTIHRTIEDNECCFVRLRARVIGLEKLDPSIFAGMHNLEEIDLTYNDIENVCGNTFKGLTKLTSLTLESALGEAMEDPRTEAFVALNGLTNLRELNLFGCRLDDKNMPDTMFDALGKLKRLILGLNFMQAPRPRLFQNLHALQVLNLSTCDIETLDKDLFKNLHALKALDLHGCQSIAELPREIFSGLTNLEDLDLSENGYTQFPAMALRNLTNLRTLNIGHCPLQELPEDALLDLINLKKLDLSHCKLRQLPAGLFCSTTNLKKLNLSSNMLTELPKDIFRKLTRLTLLDIRRNRFTPTQLQRAQAGLRHICATLDEDQEAIPALEGAAAGAPADGLADA